MSNDLDIDIVAKGVDDVVHFGAPVVTPGLDLLVVLRTAWATNQQKTSKTVQRTRRSKHLGPNQKAEESRVGSEMYPLAAVLRS